MWINQELSKVRYGGVVSTGEIAPTYSHFLCFTVTERTNSLGFFQDNYTEEQEETHRLIESMHDSGLGYRRIASRLNERGILTSRGNKWSSPQFYSVLKRHRERQERLAHIETEYESVWGRMRIEWSKN